MVENWTIGNVALLILSGCVGASTIILAIRIQVNVSWDWNKYQDQKRSDREKRLQDICPHAYRNTITGGHMGVASYFYKETQMMISEVSYICSKCGFLTKNNVYIQDLCHKWKENPDGLDQQTSKYEKALRKAKKL